MAATKGLGTTGNGVGTVTPLDHKLAMAGLLTKRGATTNLIRPGLFYDGVANIVVGTSGMSYSVQPFTAALTRGAAAGAVLLCNDGLVNVVTTAAPGSNSRIDIVYVWQREFSLDGVDSNPVIGVVQGTAAASPVAPSLAAFPGAIELARITVAAGAVATNGAGVTITQTAPFTTLDGGELVFRNATERDAATVRAGAKCELLSDGSRHVSTGAGWVAERMVAKMRRSTSALSINATTWNQNLSANTYWVEEIREGGIAAYNNGWVVPEAGVWKISFGVALAGAGSCGVTVNASTVAGFADFVGHGSAPLIQGVAMMNGDVTRRLAAGDVIRLFAVSATGTVAWDITAALSWFGIEKVS